MTPFPHNPDPAPYHNEPNPGRFKRKTTAPQAKQAHTPHSRVEHWDDERQIGNGIIVTLARGWKFASDPLGYEHVRGFDRRKDALAEVKTALRCDCIDCRAALAQAEAP